MVFTELRHLLDFNLMKVKAVFIKRYKLIFALLCLLQALLSILFGYTDGLSKMSYLVSGELIHVSDLYSTGSNDNLVIQAGSLLYLFAGLWGLVRLRTTSIAWEAAVYGVVFLLQLMLLVLIEAGSIFDSIYYGVNYILAAWVVNFLLMPLLGALTFWRLSRAERGSNPEK